MLRLAEDDCPDAQGAASRSVPSGLAFHLRLRRLQPGAHAESGPRGSSGVSPGPTCVRNRIELEPKATRVPEINPFDIIHDEKQKEKHAADQFFRSLLKPAR